MPSQSTLSQKVAARLFAMAASISATNGSVTFNAGVPQQNLVPQDWRLMSPFRLPASVAPLPECPSLDTAPLHAATVTSLPNLLAVDAYLEGQTLSTLLPRYPQTAFAD